MSDLEGSGSKSKTAKAVDRATVEHLATLSALTLSEAEAIAFTAEIAAIVGYVDELSELDTTDVPPTTAMNAGEQALRADEVAEGLSNEDALASAPRKAHGGFAVPAFVEG